MKHTGKDSVFMYMFRQPGYARKLYLAPHPEDQTVTDEDCKLVTLENIITTGIYNDVGIQVREVLIFLVEAQSTFSPNIALRLLLYVSETYKEFIFIDERRLDLYSEAPIAIPRPELYTVCSLHREPRGCARNSPPAGRRSWIL